MMYSKESLLKESIKEFQDYKNNCLVYETERIITKSGFMYILKLPNPKKISCAIHYAISYENSDLIGKVENREYSINTRERININSIIEYQGVFFAINSEDDYNQTMGQYHYRCLSSFGFIQDKFLILDSSKIEEDLSITSFPIIYSFFEERNIPFFPSHFNILQTQTNLEEKKFVSLEIKDTECVSLMKKKKIFNEGRLKFSYSQNNNDSLKFSFVNMGNKEAYGIIGSFLDFIQEKKEIGLVEGPNIYQTDIYQKSFNWKSLLYNCDMKVNYNLIIEPEDNTSKIIGNSLISMLKII